jgi:predicted DNA-binding transcriptional regulator AlpA
MESPVTTELLPKVEVYRLSDRAQQEFAQVLREAMQKFFEKRNEPGEQQRPAALGANDAAAYLGISRSLFYELRDEDPTFPTPIRFGRRRLWLISGLDNYMMARQASHSTDAQSLG